MIADDDVRQPVDYPVEDPPRRAHPAVQAGVSFLIAFAVGILIAAWAGHAWPW